MSAFGTKKPGGDRGLALTFPYNFQNAFAEKGEGYAFLEESHGPSLDIMIGDDFQSTYHEEKRVYANKTVMDGVQARRAAEIKLLTGPHNYHLPKPVLGQRVFANPSYGSESYSSSRRDGSSAPFQTVEAGLRGGVVVTAEGQAFYKDQLRDRISQLDRINAVASGFSVPMGQPYRTQDSTKDGSPSKVTFFLYLRSLSDSIISGDLSKFSFENLKELLAMLLNFGPSADVEDFNDMIAAIDEILESVRDGLSEMPQAALPIDKREYAETLELYLKAMRSYTTEMARNVNLSERDRTSLSKSLVKSLRLANFLSKKNKPSFIAAQAEIDARARQEKDTLDSRGAFFDRPVFTREDAEQGLAARQPFAGNGGDPNREAYGSAHGLIVNPGTGYFGEEEAGPDTVQDATPATVAPLATAGYDPNSEGLPSPADQSLKGMADAVIRNVLQPLMRASNEGDSVNDVIENNYRTATGEADPSRFVAEVVNAMEEQGYTPAMIARAVSLTSEANYFRDYITANTGDLRPAPAVRFPDVNPPVLNASDYIPATAAAQNAAPQLQGQALLRSLNLPESRERLREDYRTLASVLELAGRLSPRYIPRRDTPIKNIQDEIIRRIRLTTFAGF